MKTSAIYQLLTSTLRIGIALAVMLALLGELVVSVTDKTEAATIELADMEPANTDTAEPEDENETETDDWWFTASILSYRLGLANVLAQTDTRVPQLLTSGPTPPPPEQCAHGCA